MVNKPKVSPNSAIGLIPNDGAGKSLRDWIADPQAIKTQCLMPAFALSDRDRTLLVNYLMTLH